MNTFSKFLESKQSSMKRAKSSIDHEKENASDSSFNFPFKYRDTSFDTSTHAASQAKDRRPEFTKDDWKDLHKKTAITIRKEQLKNGWFLFYSKSMEQGYIGVLKNNKFKAITVLPKGKHNPQGGNAGGTTELEMMEMINLYNEEFNIIVENLDDIITILIDE